MCAAGNRLMIRDTSATDRPVEVKPKRKQQLILLGMGVLVVVLLVIFAPGIARLFSASASVSSSRRRSGCSRRPRRCSCCRADAP